MLKFEVVSRCESLGDKRIVKVYMTKSRLDMPITDEDFASRRRKGDETRESAPSIPSPENLAICDGKRAVGLLMGNAYNVGPLEKTQDTHAAEPTMPRAPTEHHYAEPVIVKPAPPS
ncbi:hypothetical protein Aduo_016223 [Ancylostoma duodenale]